MLSHKTKKEEVMLPKEGLVTWSMQSQSTLWEAGMIQ